MWNWWRRKKWDDELKSKLRWVNEERVLGFQGDRRRKRNTEFHHNSAPHSSTKTSPFSLLYGYEPRSYPTLGKTFLPTLEEWLSKLDEAWKEALVAHDSTWKLMTSRTTRRFHPWKVGDKVWLEATHLRLHYPSRKLAPKRHGPFKIIQVLSPLTYKLRLPST